MSILKIITTGDGSHSLFNESLNETYHSTHGALRESLHVFIKNGLDVALEKSSSSEISILEVGFGTGLNALLTFQKSRHISQRIVYRSLEAFPLSGDVLNQLNYGTACEDENSFKIIHEARWNIETDLSPKFTLFKEQTTLQLAELGECSFDVIYYDAFAPSKQPEMWEITLLEKVVRSIKAGGLFVTYCAKGQLKRDLKFLGLTVETLPGPPGKKEMIRGVK
jgi:tRNA U34 5-methylaminomethyl-2-thiouridine-forming methyltransferase MnmC